MESRWIEHSMNTWAATLQARKSREEFKQATFWEGKGNMSDAIDWHLVRGEETKLIKYILPLY